MGKGDIKTRKGKIWKGSYGKKRLRASVIRRMKKLNKNTSTEDKQ